MGAFIVIEGIDGTGKSTVCRRAAAELTADGLDVEVTAEPTHEGIGALIRSGAAGPVSQRAESLLFAADRCEHTDRILRAVEEGRVVICDRYYPSTVAYQSAALEGDSADREWLMDVCRPFIGVPDAVILLDMDPEASMARVGARGAEGSKFEDVRFLCQVRAEYLRLAEERGFAVVDASRPEDDVARDVIAIIRGVL